MSSTEGLGQPDWSVPNWERERCRALWDPSRRLLRAIRAYQWCRARPWVRWLRGYWVVQHRFWSIVTGSEIPLNCRIRGGLMLPHPNGVVIHSDVEIGANCLIFQQVTIGTGARGIAVPSIGNHVDVGAGAKILGGVTVGDNALIGANAVVLRDVPPGATAVGIPARILRPVDRASPGDPERAPTARPAVDSPAL